MTLLDHLTADEREALVAVVVELVDETVPSEPFDPALHELLAQLMARAVARRRIRIELGPGQPSRQRPGRVVDLSQTPLVIPGVPQ